MSLFEQRTPVWVSDPRHNLIQAPVRPWANPNGMGGTLPTDTSMAAGELSAPNLGDNAVEKMLLGYVEACEIIGGTALPGVAEETEAAIYALDDERLLVAA